MSVMRRGICFLVLLTACDGDEFTVGADDAAIQVGGDAPIAEDAHTDSVGISTDASRTLHPDVQSIGPDATRDVSDPVDTSMPDVLVAASDTSAITPDTFVPMPDTYVPAPDTFVPDVPCIPKTECSDGVTCGTQWDGCQGIIQCTGCFAPDCCLGTACSGSC